MFNKVQKTKTAKLARLKNTGKFGCTVSVFNMSVMIVVRLFRSFSCCSMCSASSSYAMHGNNLIACHNPTPNRTAYHNEYVLRADMPRQNYVYLFFEYNSKILFIYCTLNTSSQ